MKIEVKTDTSTYEVWIQKDLIKDAKSIFNLQRKVLIVTDSGIPAIYSKQLSSQCLLPYLYIIPEGEESKNITQYQKILTYMIENHFSRDDCVVALGGGVVGDLSGFVSATYMRGIDFYNIPTTLLAQVDSSIGGKTAINFLTIKNIVGCFYPPKAVLIDSNILKTLSTRHLYSGLVEALKMATTCDEHLFELIENSKDLWADMDEIIYRSLKIKQMVVEQDIKEQGLRKILNFGHTIGHAIESSGHLSTLLHGECVGIGMLYMSSPLVKNRLRKVLEKYHLPTHVDAPCNQLLTYMQHDKKVTNENVSIIYVDKVGSYEIRKIPLCELKKYVEEEGQ